MFATPSSTTVVDSLSSSPTSTTSPNSTSKNKLVLKAKDEFESNQSYTIYLPANVRFRGMNMHFDLKIDKETLDATSSEISISKNIDVRESGISKSSNDDSELSLSSRDTNLFSLENLKNDQRSAPSLSRSDDSARRECQKSGREEDSKQLQSVSSTTAEQVDQSFGEIATTSDETSSHSDDVPVTSTIFTSQEEAEAVVDTTTTTSSTEERTTNNTFARSCLNENRKAEERSDIVNLDCLRTFSKSDLVLHHANSSQQASSSSADCCTPSSSSEAHHCQAELIIKDAECKMKKAEDSEKILNDSNSLRDDEASLHDSQPCSSSNLSASEQISSTNASDGVGAVKKKRLSAAPNFCGFIDTEKGQCKQRAILNFKYCIRHILLDPTAPYRQCQHKRKPKNKKEDFVLCTNAIRMDKSEIFCSTHLIMKGMLQPKSKKGASVLLADIQSRSPASIVSPTVANKTPRDDFLDDATTASVKSAVDSNNLSFESMQNSLLGVSAMGSTRTGRESTSSWDQMSIMSGSITPNQSFSAITQNNIAQSKKVSYGGQLSDLQHGRNDVMIASDTMNQNMPTQPNNFVSARNMENCYQHELAVSKNSHLIETAAGGAKYFPQQSLYFNGGNSGKSQCNSQNDTSKHFFNLPTTGIYQPQMRQPISSHTTPPPSSPFVGKFLGESCGDQKRENCRETGSNNTVSDPRLAVAYQQRLPISTGTARSQPMSRLSKQHPHLAAKLLQPTSNQQKHMLYTNAAHYSGYEYPTIISSEKSATFPSPAKRMRHEMANQFVNPAVKRSEAVADGMSVGPAFPHSIYEQPNLLQYSNNQALVVAGASQPLQYLKPFVDENGRQLFKTNLHQQRKGLHSFALNNRGLNENLLNQANLRGFLHNPSSVYPAMPNSQFSSQQLAKLLPKSAYIQYQTKLMEAMASQCVDISSFIDAEPKPAKYRISSIIEDLSDEEAKIRRDYLNNGNDIASIGGGCSTSTVDQLSQQQNQRRSNKSISLRQKQHKLRITGAFRNIPLVDSMCKIIEYHDFDSTDLFPLGLEPSDDESLSDDSFPAFNNELGASFSSSSNNSGESLTSRCLSNRIELYLLKKKLRLESSRLVQGAKVSMPIIEAAKVYKKSVGAALRIRQMNRRRESIIGVEKSRHRLCQFEQKSVKSEVKQDVKPSICRRLCLPMSNYCADHILYSVEQKLFTYCSRVCCGRPVLCADATLFNGMCRAHYNESITPRSLSSETPYNSKLHVIETTNQSAKHINNFAIVTAPIYGSGAVTTCSASTAPYKQHLTHPLNSVQQLQFHNTNAVKTTANNLHYSLNSHRHSAVGNGQLGQPSVAQHTLNSSKYFTDHVDQSNDDVVEDVSLASVAKDLGLNGHELTDMLEKLPVDDSLDGNDMEEDDGDGFLEEMKSEDDVSGLTLGHSWADVEQFLLSEGYHAKATVMENQL